MIGTTLQDIRSHITALASETGTYYLACAHYGERPVPACGLRFESRSVARAAARATEQYRAALRRYDPQLPHYDVIVCQENRPGAVTQAKAGQQHQCTDTSWTLSEPVLSGQRRTDRDLVEFCHRVAAAVFETLSAYEHDAVESAVMDAYFEVAEQLSTPDGLCLCLLEGMATEIATRLSASDQVEILADATARVNADRLNSGKPIESGSVDSAFSRLDDLGLVGSYERTERKTTSIELNDYALSPYDDRLPLLPILVELHRCGQQWTPVAASHSTGSADWHVEFVPVGERLPARAAAAPVAPEVV
jgi:uncharacterized protein YejL (UPF0352 family)